MLFRPQAGPVGGKNYVPSYYAKYFFFELRKSGFKDDVFEVPAMKLKERTTGKKVMV
jgi:hypothetical protein